MAIGLITHMDPNFVYFSFILSIAGAKKQSFVDVYVGTAIGASVDQMGHLSWDL